MKLTFTFLMLCASLAAQIDTATHGATFFGYNVLTSPFTMPSCSNSLMLVWAMSDSGGTVSGVNWDSLGTPVAMTHVAGADMTTGITRMYLYQLVNPVLTGTHQITISASGGEWHNVATYNCGVNPATPVKDFHIQDTASSMSTNDPTATITPTVDNTWQMSGLVGTGFVGFFSAQGCSATIRQNLVNTSEPGHGVIWALVSAGPIHPAAASNCDWTTPGNVWSAVTVTLNPAVGGKIKHSVSGSMS